MRNNPNRLKKWLFSYLAISILLFLLSYLSFPKEHIRFFFEIIKPAVVNGSYFIVTFFFYVKITQKSIWWILTTIFLACFLSLLLSLITTIFKSSNTLLINYIFFNFLWITFNTLFMFAGVYIEKKTVVNNWEENILDDTNI